MKIDVREVAYHRNGVAGDGFHVVRFTARSAGKGEFIATVFDGPGQVAILNVPELAAGNIAFAEGNSWRCEDFEPAMRAAVEQYEASRTLALTPA